MQNKEIDNYKMKTFILNKVKETISKYIIAFVYLPEFNEQCFGTLKINKNLQEFYSLKNNEVYEIYMKLNSEICVETRMILCKIHDK